MANLEHFDFEVSVKQVKKVFKYCIRNKIYFKAQEPSPNGACRVDVMVEHIDEWEKLIVFINSISEWYNEA